MKVKGLDKFQHYYLDRIAEKDREGHDLPTALSFYANIGHKGLHINAEERANEFADIAHRVFSAYRAKDPANGQWRTWGFVNPLIGQPEIEIRNHEGEEETTQRLLDVIPGTTAVMLCVEKRERVLPSSSLADKVWERVKAFEEREQRSATKKDWAILKDEVTAAELTKAPIKRSRIWVVLWEWDCYVFTSSQKAAEETNALIRTAFSSWPTIPAYVNEELIQTFFRNVMLRDKSTSGSFIPGDKAILMNSEKEKITVSDSDLEESRYLTLVQEEHFKPTELLFMYYRDEAPRQRVWVKMNKKGDVKSFSLAAAEEGEEDGGEDIKQQKERGSASYDSKIAEVWMLLQSLGVFSGAMQKTGVMLPRDDLTDIVDGDAFEEQNDKSKGGRETVAPEPEDDDLPEEEPEEEDDDTFDLPPDDEDNI